MNHFFLLGIFGLLLFNGCIESEKAPSNHQIYCESIGGIYSYEVRIGTLASRCEFKNNEIWETFYIKERNGVFGLER